MSRGKCVLAPSSSQGVYEFTKLCVPDYTKHPVTAVAGKNAQIGKSAFSGKFDQVKVGMYITKVIYNDPATIVFWSDDTKTMCKAQHGDTYNREAGLALCVLKKLVGGDQVASLLTEWTDEDSNVIDLKYLRNKKKSSKKETITIDIGVSKEPEEVPITTTAVSKKSKKK